MDQQRPEKSPRRLNSKRGPIVSSEHLSHSDQELSEFEYGLIVAGHAFNRWMVRCILV